VPGDARANGVFHARAVVDARARLVVFPELSLTGLGIDAYVAGLVHRSDELGEQERRAVSIAGRCRAYVAFASFAGPTGGGYHHTAGSSAIWSPAADVLAQAGMMPGDLARATLE
jgi:predicted amidohydrolase